MEASGDIWKQVEQKHKEAKKAIEKQERKGMDEETFKQERQVIEELEKKRKDTKVWQRKKPRSSN